MALVQTRAPYRGSSADHLTYTIMYRNGDVWYKYRSAINKKMLKLAEVVEFMPDMDRVAQDMVKYIGEDRNKKDIVPDMSPILFKWALECMYSTSN